MPEIDDMDAMGQELRIRWRKANNYYRSFTTMLFKTKDEFAGNPYGPEWPFHIWLARKAGLIEEQVLAQLKVFQRVIAADERQKIAEANIRLAVEKRRAREIAKAEAKQRRNERAIAKAHQDRERETVRAEKESERQEAEAERKRQTNSVANAARLKNRRAQLKAKCLIGPENPDLVRLLAKCEEIEKPTRPQLGECYLAMKEIVDTHQAGKNPNNEKYWTWGEWAGFYIHRSRRDINRCIEEFGTSCPIEHSENVVSFPKNVA
jgi:hypothetical protein